MHRHRCTFHDMVPRRTFATLLGAVFALQLLLPAALGACAMADHAAAEGGVVSTANGDPMAQMQMPMDMRMDIGTDGESDDGPPPCDHAMSPEQCRTMAPCAAGFIVPSAVAAAPGAHLHAQVIATLTDLPPSVTSSPEPPPPRA
jgi:hypothetical protein